MKVRSFILILILSLTTTVKAQVEIVSSGTSSAYVLNVPAIFPLRNGVQVTFKAHSACTAAPTINVTGTGAINITKEGGNAPLAGGDIQAGQIVTLAYDGTNWQMLTASGNPSTTGALTGFGTQNQVAKWDNVSGTTLGNSSIFDDGTSVGIFNNTPAGDLHIFKNNGPRFIMDGDGGNVNGSATIDFTTGGNNSSSSFVGTGGVTGWQLKSYSAAFNPAGRQNDFALRFYNGTSFVNSMYFDNNGNIGIDFLNPTSKLYIVGSGSTNATSSLRITNSSSADMLYVNDNGQVGIRTSIPSANLHVVGTARITSLVGPGTVIADASGNLSIATGSNSTNWTLLGNLGTVDGTNFIGTTDNVPFNIRVNGQKAGRIENTGGNTFFGYQSGLVNTGTNNSGFGYQTLNSNTSGGSNSAVGLQALFNNTTGNNNVAEGFLTMVMNTVGSNNTAIGYHALTSSKAASNATAVGYNAMYYANDQTTPYNNNNVALGYEALRGSTTASNNTGLANTSIGYQTLQANSSGTGNSVLGATAMQGNTTGNYNVSLGTSTLLTNTTGTGNLAAGTSSMLNNATGSYNVALGYEAMYNNRSGSNAVAIGYNSMRYANNTGTAFTNYNVAVGFEALRGSVSPSSNTGNNNTATGAMALSANSSGYENTANGMYSLYINSTGYDNTATGYSALNSNLGGYWNTASGGYALSGNTSGIRNAGFGFQAGSANQTGNDNVFIGTQAGFFGNNHSNNTFVGAFSGANNTASNGVFLGYNSGYYNTSGSANTYLGFQSGYTNTTSGNNTMVGYQTGYATTSSNNSFFGSNVGQGNTSGAQNTFLGAYAGSNNTTGSQNVFIGYSADILTTTQRNKSVAIGYNARVDADNVMALGGAGVDAVKVGIGTPVPSTQLHVVGNARITGLVGPGTVVADASGNLSVATGGTITGSGSTNYVARWTPTGTTLGTGTLYDNGTYVGIGTNSPGYNLDVTSTTGSSFIQARSTTGLAGVIISKGNASSNSYLVLQTASVDKWTIGTIGNENLNFRNWATGTDAVNILSSNNYVGIGAATPGAKLEVADAAFFKVRLNRTSGTGNKSELSFAKNGADRFSIGTDAGETGAQEFYIFDNVSNTTRVLMNANGSVGIGTLSPTSKLHAVHAADISKYTIRGEASQSTTSTDYQNVAVLGFGKGQPGWGYGNGVMGIADAAGSYYATGVYAGLSPTVPTLPVMTSALYANGNSLGLSGYFTGGAVNIDNIELINQTKTGTANLVPICYGNISSAGTINTAASTNNFTVNKTGTGQYSITITGESYFFSNYTTSLTINTTACGSIGSNSVGSNLLVNTYNCSGVLTDYNFTFIVYKP
ncbi:MAG: hypothetical protein K0Q95_3355 [Bacteroidota bacterium]|jgi:hypothetical protein|nr:hypothetical protein [Bacteroidota bacterium]